MRGAVRERDEELKPGTVRFAFTESVTEIKAINSAFQSAYKGATNPGLANSFPVLSSIARNFEQYDFVKLKYSYRSSVSYGNQTATGTVAIGHTANPGRELFMSKRGMLNSSSSVSGRITDNIELDVDADGGPLGGVLYVRTEASSTATGIRTQDLGYVQLVVDGVNTTSAIGTFHVEYEVLLYNVHLYTEPIRVGVGVSAIVTSPNVPFGKELIEPYVRAPFFGQAINASPVTTSVQPSRPTSEITYTVDASISNFKITPSIGSSIAVVAASLTGEAGTQWLATFSADVEMLSDVVDPAYPFTVSDVLDPLTLPYSKSTTTRFIRHSNRRLTFVSETLYAFTHDSSVAGTSVAWSFSQSIEAVAAPVADMRISGSTTWTMQKVAATYMLAYPPQALPAYLTAADLSVGSGIIVTYTKPSAYIQTTPVQVPPTYAGYEFAGSFTYGCAYPSMANDLSTHPAWRTPSISVPMVSPVFGDGFSDLVSTPQDIITDQLRMIATIVQGQRYVLRVSVNYAINFARTCTVGSTPYDGIYPPTSTQAYVEPNWEGGPESILPAPYGGDALQPNVFVVSTGIEIGSAQQWYVRPSWINNTNSREWFGNKTTKVSAKQGWVFHQSYLPKTTSGQDLQIFGTYIHEYIYTANETGRFKMGIDIANCSFRGQVTAGPVEPIPPSTNIPTADQFVIIPMPVGTSTLSILPVSDTYVTPSTWAPGKTSNLHEVMKEETVKPLWV